MNHEAVVAAASRHDERAPDDQQAGHGLPNARSPCAQVGVFAVLGADEGFGRPGYGNWACRGEGD